MNPNPNRVLCITGAGTGLGAGLAQRLATPGTSLVLHAHAHLAEAETLAAELTAAGSPASAFRADLTHETGALALAHHIRETHGRLDALINNTGVYHEKDLLDLSEEEWLTGLHTTASAVFFTSRACLPLLRQSPHGRIINIGDASCDRPGARDLAAGYHIGKTGVLILTKSFARELAPHGITVNMISPGYLENSKGLPDPATLPAGRFGTFDDVAHAARFLLDPAASYLTGSNLLLTGGWNLR